LNARLVRKEIKRYENKYREEEKKEWGHTGDEIGGGNSRSCARGTRKARVVPYFPGWTDWKRQREESGVEAEYMIVTEG